MKRIPSTAPEASLSLEIMFGYLEGSLDPEATQRVDRILAEEPEWIDVMEGLAERLRHDPDTKLKAAAFRDLVAEVAAAPPVLPAAKVQPLSPTPTSRILLLRVAAVALVLIVSATLVWVNLSPGFGYEAMAGQYLRPYDATTVKGGSLDATARLEQGLATYQAGQYDQAYTLLQALQASDQLSEDEVLTTRMYLGMSALFAGHPAQAEQQLTDLIAAGPTPYQEAAAWYLAWSLWQQDKLAAARQAFREVANGYSLYKEEARSILDQWEE